MLTNEEIVQVFGGLWSDLDSENSFPKKRPTLAHYTSISVLEKIMSGNEVWFSNPLYMNDMEEVRFGMMEGERLFLMSADIEAACNDSNRYNVVRSTFGHLINDFSNKLAFDTYVFCMSEHEKPDGLLSMWRGYGGNGAGAAIVIDTKQIDENEASPFIIDKVSYGSADERRSWIIEKITEFSRLLRENSIPTEKLYIPVHLFFERLKLFSLFSKHHGFEEEREWRFVYMPDRDTSGGLKSMLGYAVGKNGVEPKLKFNVSPMSGTTADDFSIEKIVSKIILGPTISSPLAKSAVCRMLEQNGKQSLVLKVEASTIPYRAT